MESIDLEDVMKQIGEFGPYQFKQHLLHLIAPFLAGLHLMSFSFVAAIPKHRCFIDEIDAANGTSNVSLSHFFPMQPNGELSNCVKFRPKSNLTESCNNSYAYDKTYHKSSIVMDWNLVCDNKWIRAVFQTIYMLGILCGAVILGTLSDLLGRKPIFYTSGLLQLVFGLACALVENKKLYATFLFFYGAFGSGGAYVVGFVLTMEIVGTSKRTICGTAFSASFALGSMMVAVWAYFLPDSYKLLQYIFAAHSLLLIGHWWLMDESIRWLWGQGKKKKALKIAVKAAKANGRKFEYIFDDNANVLLEEEDDSDSSDFTHRPVQSNVERSPMEAITDLFRRPRLRCRTFLTAFIFFANSMVYYGLSFNTGNLQGNPYLLFLLNALAEMPAYLIVVTMVDKTGRRSLTSLFMLLGGLACIGIAFIPDGIGVTTVAILAKVAISGSFSIIYNYSSELFPTPVRSSVLGISAMSARFGGMLAPQIILLNYFFSKLPTLIFGCVAVSAAFLVLFLPETLNKKLPESIEEGENFGRGDTAFHRVCTVNWRKNEERSN